MKQSSFNNEKENPNKMDSISKESNNKNKTKYNNLNKQNEESFNLKSYKSPRGRQFIKDKDLVKIYKNSAYRNTSSSSTVGKSKRNRHGNKTANYISDNSIDKDDVKVKIKIIDKLYRNKIKDNNKNHFNSNNNSPNQSLSHSGHFRNNCYCCSTENMNTEDEENKLPQEVYQILSEVYEGHMEEKNIDDLVKNYHQSVFEFCQKEDSYEIVYFIKIFILKVIEVMKGIKFDLVKNPIVSKLKRKFDEIVRMIEKRYFSKNRGNIGCSFVNKHILNEIYTEQLDDKIVFIMNRLYSIYDMFISSSSDISLIFSPGVNKIGKFDFSFEDLHKQQFDQIFLKDPFIKNIITIVKSRKIFISDPNIQLILNTIDSHVLENEIEKLIEGTDKEIKKLEYENNNKINFTTYKSNDEKISIINQINNEEEKYQNNEIIIEDNGIIVDKKMNIDDLLEYINTNTNTKTINTKSKKSKLNKKITSKKENDNKKTLNTDLSSKKISKAKSNIKYDEKRDESEDEFVNRFKNNILNNTCHSSYIQKENPNIFRNWIDNISELNNINFIWTEMS